MSISRAKGLMVLKEPLAGYYDSHTQHINAMCGYSAEFWTLKQEVYTELLRFEALQFFLTTLKNN